MSRNALILDQAVNLKTSAAPLSADAEPNPVPHSSEYAGLVRTLFPPHAVVAIFQSGAGNRASEACRGIAAELALSGRRAVIVQVDALLRLSELPDTAACRPAHHPNVSLWPSSLTAPVEFFGSPAPATVDDWLPSLRRDFAAVLLDCPSLETAPAAATIASQADSTLLVVEAGHTTKQQIQQDQKALQLRGVKLAGCVLMRRR